MVFLTLIALLVVNWNKIKGIEGNNEDEKNERKGYNLKSLANVKKYYQVCSIDLCFFLFSH